MICEHCALCEKIEHDTCFCHAIRIYFSLADIVYSFECHDFKPKESEVSDV